MKPQRSMTAGLLQGFQEHFPQIFGFAIGLRGSDGAEAGEGRGGIVYASSVLIEIGEAVPALGELRINLANQGLEIRDSGFFVAEILMDLALGEVTKRTAGDAAIGCFEILQHNGEI